MLPGANVSCSYLPLGQKLLIKKVKLQIIPSKICLFSFHLYSFKIFNFSYNFLSIFNMTFFFFLGRKETDVKTKKQNKSYYKNTSHNTNQHNHKANWSLWEDYHKSQNLAVRQLPSLPTNQHIDYCKVAPFQEWLIFSLGIYLTKFLQPKIRDARAILA